MPSRRSQSLSKDMSSSPRIQAFTSYGVDETTASAAVARQDAEHLHLIAVTGKLASGKDTIAENVMAALGVETPYHLSFAAALKVELDDIIALMRTAADREVALDMILDRGVHLAHAHAILDFLYLQVRSDRTLTARSRTPQIRGALQVWGLDVRRGQDPQYWVKQAVRAAAGAIADGRHVMITDVRFPDEVRACQAIGFTVVRLHVTAETQAQRLWDRDGLAPDPAAIGHASETALDDYQPFDVDIDNNGSIEQGVESVLAHMSATASR
jgi:hypothetical protein